MNKLKDLKWIVPHTLSKKVKILSLLKKYPSPFFAYDREDFVKGIINFQKTFKKYIPNSEFFFAMKSNPHEYLLQDVARNRMGIDVSSGRELDLALAAKPKKILFTGPGKSEKEIEKAINLYPKVILNIDSVAELEKVIETAKRKKKKIDIGIRVHTSYHGRWNKFGIPLSALANVWKKALLSSYVRPIGIQAHMSWNEDATPYKKVITEIGKYLLKNKFIYDSLSFIDLGGGFLTHNLQGMYVKNEQGTKVNKKPIASVLIEEYANEIGEAIKKNFQNKNLAFYFEPGRVISVRAMHIVLTVIDVKDRQTMITDGGANMVGWIENDYWPIINLTRPSRKELRCNVWGSLCTPEDIWGYYIYAEKINVGDILIIPFQGAYTYTHAQAFIKEFPRVYKL